MTVKIISELSNIVGTAGLVLPNDLQNRASSFSDSEPHRALALIRPSSIDEVSQVMAVCNRYGQSVVLQGGLTGLVEGATATSNDLALSLERLTGIESLDVIGKTITVTAGTVIQTVQDAAESHDLMFAVDWGARGSATVGGAIATNAGGSNVLRYGMMRENVLGLEVVLPDGTILSSLNTLMKNNTGYDLKQLFIGSEGTLGVITRAVLKLHALPKARQTALVALSNFDDVIALLGKLQSGLGGALNAFEVMWQSFYDMIVTHGEHNLALPMGSPFYVLIEAGGGDEETLIKQFESVLEMAMEAGLIDDAIICQTDTQREFVWNIREDVDTIFRVLDPAIPFDVSLPVVHAEAYVDKVNKDIFKIYPNARGITFGHLGDGNLHFCWSIGSANPDETSRVSKIVYDNLMPYNGSISAEHGIGFSKRKYLNHSRSETEILWMKKIKFLFDPNNLLNPGCIFNISSGGNKNAKNKTTY